MVWGERISVGLENPYDEAGLSREDLAGLFAAPFVAGGAPELGEFCTGLAREIEGRRDAYITAFDEETGFSKTDVEEIFEAVVAFLREFQPLDPPVQTLTP